MTLVGFVRGTTFNIYAHPERVEMSEGRLMKVAHLFRVFPRRWPWPCRALGVLAQQAGVVAPPGVHPISGRRFAQVMSAEGAAWLDRPERIEEEEPDRALDVLKIPKGAVVADVGAGSGYMTVKLSKRVGPTGKVYADDIQPEMLRLLGLRLTARQDHATSLSFRATVDNPGLPAVDARSRAARRRVSRVFGAADDAAASARGVQTRRSARAARIPERRSVDSDPAGAQNERARGQARSRSGRYTLSQVNESLPRQHILVFTKR